MSAFRRERSVFADNDHAGHGWGDRAEPFGDGPAGLGASRSPLTPLGMQSLFGNAATRDELSRSGGGSGLPYQARLEAAYGQDLSHLEVRSGGAASAQLGALNAAGACDHGTLMLPQGAPFEVVAHEVAHALQHERFGSPSTGVSRGDEAAERDADQAAARASAGQPARIQAAPTSAVHRWGLGDVWEGAKDVASDAWEGTKEVAGDAAEAVGSVVPDWVGEAGGAAWDGVAEVGSDVGGILWDTVTDPIDYVGDAVGGTLNTIGDVWDTAWDPNLSLEEKLTQSGGLIATNSLQFFAEHSILDPIEDAAAVYDLVRDGVLAVTDVGTILGQGFAEDVAPLLQAGVELGGDLLGGLVEGGGGLLGDLVSGGGDLLGDLVSGGGDLLGDLVSGGGDLLGDLVSGGGDLIAGGVDLLGDLVSGGIDLGTDLGQSLVEGIAGLDTGIPFIDDLVDSGASTLSDLIGGGGDLLGDLVDGGADLLSWAVDSGSEWLGDGLSGLSDLLGEGISGLTGFLGDGISGLADWAGGGISDLSEWMGGGIRDAADLVSGGIGDFAASLNNACEGLRSFFGLDEDGNDFTGHIEIPESTDTFTQQYSELGLPLTDKAWGFQDAVDGGKLRALYDQTLMSSLDQEVLDDLVAQGVMRADQIPEDWSQVDPATLRELTESVEAHYGSAQDLLNSMEPDQREEFQEQVLHSYMEMARNDDNAAFIFELLPTETGDTPGDLQESAQDWLIQGQSPNNFAVGENVGNARLSDVKLAEHYQDQGMNTYGLVVPYANTPSNVIGRNGTPTDGSDHLHNYLNMLVDPVTGERDITTVATGYSQGGAATLDYVDRYGDEGLLDYAVAIAPMGGTDRQGGTGVYSGEWNGVQTLSVMNEQDPAQHIHGDDLGALLPGMINFSGFDVPGLGGIGERHGTYWGQPGSDYDMEGATDEEKLAAFQAGTFGYPTEYIQPMIEDLLNGRAEGHEYEERGTWDFDLNELLGFSPEEVEQMVKAGTWPESFDLSDEEALEIAEEYAPK